jgi:Mrp family chromosome partitioning ATPase
MSDCSSCPSKGKCGNDSGSCGVQTNPLNKVKHIIGVMSGKGGVGKSTVSAMLARELKKLGYEVGLMDADITGPSATRLMGITGQRAYGKDNMIIPVESEEGIKVMSLNLLLEDENQPVVWRGSMLSNCVKQFWNETLWGELDYLVVDMPPGTGDVTLTVMQSIPLSGVIMVSVPQDMVNMIVNKSINMTKLMKVNILGVVENMSYIVCPHCGEKIKIFNGENTQKFLAENGIALLGELPTDPTVSAMSENGYENVKAEIATEFVSITQNVINAL